MLNINKSQIPGINYSKTRHQKLRIWIFWLKWKENFLKDSPEEGRKWFSRSLWLLEFLEVLWLGALYQNSQTKKIVMHAPKNPVWKVQMVRIMLLAKILCNNSEEFAFHASKIQRQIRLKLLLLWLSHWLPLSHIFFTAWLFAFLYSKVSTSRAFIYFARNEKECRVSNL